MSKLPVFVFGTPEGGANDLSVFFDKQGYQVLGSLEKPLHEVWACADGLNGGIDGIYGDGDLEFVKEMLFPDAKAPAIYINNYVGYDYGWGFRVWFALVRNFPDVKIIFPFLDLDKNLSRVMARNKVWIPIYGSCPSKCEKNLKNQMRQMTEFAECYPDNALTFNVFSDPFEKITNFLNEKA